MGSRIHNYVAKVGADEVQQDAVRQNNIHNRTSKRI